MRVLALAAFENGHASLFCWLISTFQLPPLSPHFHRRKALLQYSDRDLERNLERVLAKSPSGRPDGRNPKEIPSLVVIARCLEGNPDTLPEAPVSSRVRGASRESWVEYFCSAAAGGHVKSLEWLSQKLTEEQEGLTSQNLQSHLITRSLCYSAPTFQAAAATGSVDTLFWLRRKITEQPTSLHPPPDSATTLVGAPVPLPTITPIEMLDFWGGPSSPIISAVTRRWFHWNLKTIAPSVVHTGRVDALRLILQQEPMRAIGVQHEISGVSLSSLKMQLLQHAADEGQLGVVQFFCEEYGLEQLLPAVSDEGGAGGVGGGGQHQSRVREGFSFARVRDKRVLDYLFSSRAATLLFSRPDAQYAPRTFWSDGTNTGPEQGVSRGRDLAIDAATVFLAGNVEALRAMEVHAVSRYGETIHKALNERFFCSRWLTQCVHTLVSCILCSLTNWERLFQNPRDCWDSARDMFKLLLYPLSRLSSVPSVGGNEWVSDAGRRVYSIWEESVERDKTCLREIYDLWVEGGRVELFGAVSGQPAPFEGGNALEGGGGQGQGAGVVNAFTIPVPPNLLESALHHLGRLVHEHGQADLFNIYADLCVGAGVWELAVRVAERTAGKRVQPQASPPGYKGVKLHSPSAQDVGAQPLAGVQRATTESLGRTPSSSSSSFVLIDTMFDRFRCAFGLQPVQQPFFWM
uniref:Uncharacterized protein n=1 Tax=Chromera velia CCMP2878 TaxID=1169474 RepID=A0A0G4G9F4_9ALVE|eukprot:Cvel_20871.t1-p1 / transcript=Cvel_20871.t1 / gene=Cvel_20871 / organism=Chromera_velia_CCMP2878 / gene_product=hypothetical protein / transcript_product=hypothetical protein / location=Cvel_scaffold1913:7884-9950(-) / protein_length=689 / sequence_SO=supercontig / SO=protein_coding / is_pseudo=false